MDINIFKQRKKCNSWSAPQSIMVMLNKLWIFAYMCVVLGLLFSSPGLYGKRRNYGDRREDSDRTDMQKGFQSVI